jgi:threonylcarbamoyladenosine tRNA methylthiotransferase MtaB
MPRFHSISFGCRASQADAAAVGEELRRRGFDSAGGPSEADVVVLHSCTVTSAADADLRQTVRRIHRANPAARILVTGCYAQRKPEELAALPGVQWVVGNSRQAEIGALLAEQGSSAGSRNSFVPLQTLLRRPSDPESSEGNREDWSCTAAAVGSSGGVFAAAILVGDVSAERSFPVAPVLGGAAEERTRPNLKIQDGCNNRCSFCIIPSVRGPSRSLTVSDVLTQIRSLCHAGYREVVLSGINLGQYGRDLTGEPGAGKPRFVRLLQAILQQTPVERLRLSSVEPMDFTGELLDLMAGSERIARHVHAPLQSGSDRILRRMHRKYDSRNYRDRILAAFERMPQAAFGADVIVGFPGESDQDFEQTRGLIESLPFTYLHVFPFSRRPGTPADTMEGQVHGSAVRERGRILRELAAQKNRRFRERQVGGLLTVLTLEETTSGGTSALSDNYLKVFIPGERLPANQWVSVQVTSVTEQGLTGESRHLPCAQNETGGGFEARDRVSHSAFCLLPSAS